MTLNVLIVEDDPKIAEIHRHYTEKVEGFSVCGIADCLADAKVAATLMEPDLILLDLYFPEGLGLEILWQVRSRRQSTDVILVTAAKEIQHLQDAIRGGAFDYIVKPVMFPRFKETLLKFRKHREGLERGDLMDQVHVDRLLHPFKESPAGAPEYPKGVDPLTLKRIEAIFDQSRPDGLSA